MCHVLSSVAFPFLFSFRCMNLLVYSELCRIHGGSVVEIYFLLSIYARFSEFILYAIVAINNTDYCVTRDRNWKLSLEFLLEYILLLLAKRCRILCNCIQNMCFIHFITVTLTFYLKFILSHALHR